MLQQLYRTIVQITDECYFKQDTRLRIVMRGIFLGCNTRKMFEVVPVHSIRL